VKKLITILLVACFILVPSIAIVNTAHAQAIPNEVSVKLKYHLKERKTIPFEVVGAYQSVDQSGLVLTGKNFEARVNGSIIDLYEGTTKIASYQNEMEIQPVKYGKSNYIKLNGRPYLGTIRFTLEQGFLVPINTLPMEDYLKGVLPGEIFPSWHMEAQKAQAVAARTYALKRVHTVMTDDVGSQRYDGYIWWDESKYKNTNEGVNATKGQVLTYKGILIEAVFSSNNGGFIESNKGAWPGGTQLDYLKAKEDKYDPAFDWGLQFRETQIHMENLDWTNPQAWWDATAEAGIKNPLHSLEAKVLNNLKTAIVANQPTYKEAEIKITEINDVAVSNTMTPGQRRTHGSYTVHYMVKNKDGSYVMEKVLIDGEEVNRIKLHSFIQADVPIATMRTAFGLNEFKSHFVTSINLKDGVYDLKGKGWGHGVGMSQYGAKAMADQGKSYKEILGFYYEGTTFENYIHDHINNGLSGADRYATSVAIANYGWEAGFQTVVIGRGDNPVDALTGSVLAKKHDAPLVLVETNEIPQAVKELLGKQTIHQIFVLGGDSAVSDQTVKELNQYATQVTRVHGHDRYTTSVEVAKKVGIPNEAFITFGNTNSPDALSIASYAARNQIPILFTEKEQLPATVEAYLKGNNIRKVTVIGGQAVVSDQVYNRLKDFTDVISRVSGADRYATSVAIVNEYNLDPRNLFFAQGERFIDALPGSVLAANMGAPLLLTEKDELPTVLEGYLKEEIHFIPSIHYLGGTAAISNQTREGIEQQILE
jgi:SpoIID/LytB domain protein